MKLPQTTWILVLQYRVLIPLIKHKICSPAEWLKIKTIHMLLSDPPAPRHTFCFTHYAAALKHLTASLHATALLAQIKINRTLHLSSHKKKQTLLKAAGLHFGGRRAKRKSFQGLL